MRYKSMARILLHGLTWAAAAIVIYSEPLGEWLDEHYPIGGRKSDD